MKLNNKKLQKGLPALLRKAFRVSLSATKSKTLQSDPSVMKKKSLQAGESLLLTILVMSLILGTSLGIGYILLQEAKITRDLGNSVVAFYAADTGIEKAMMSPSLANFNECFSYPNNDICYSVTVSPGVDCSSSNYCLQSVGIYKNTRRAIETKF
jgi:hypothetical protein